MLNTCFRRHKKCHLCTTNIVLASDVNTRPFEKARCLFVLRQNLQDMDEEDYKKIEDNTNVDSRCWFSCNIQQFSVLLSRMLIFILAGWYTKPQSQDTQMTHPGGLCFFSANAILCLKNINAEYRWRVSKGWDRYPLLYALLLSQQPSLTLCIVWQFLVLLVGL